jgi:hypothetical protein
VTRVNLVNREHQRVFGVFFKSDLNDPIAANFMFVTADRRNESISVVAYCRQIEELIIVFEADPETAIIRVFKINLRFTGFCPQF